MSEGGGGLKARAVTERRYSKVNEQQTQLPQGNDTRMQRIPMSAIKTKSVGT